VTRQEIIAESIEYAVPIVGCTIESWPDGTNRYVFPCKFCYCNHTHSPKDGHRVAHCISDKSPYKDGGYILMGCLP